MCEQGIFCYLKNSPQWTENCLLFIHPSAHSLQPSIKCPQSIIEPLSIQPSIIHLSFIHPLSIHPSSIIHPLCIQTSTIHPYTHASIIHSYIIQVSPSIIHPSLPTKALFKWEKYQDSTTVFEFPKKNPDRKREHTHYRLAAMFQINQHKTPPCFILVDERGCLN